MSALWWLLPRLGVAFPLALVLGLCTYRWIVPEVVWWLYNRHQALHRLLRPDISQGAGSEDLDYYTMTYDCRRGDVHIEGRAPDSRYWMIGIYDLWMRAVDGGHANHRTLPVDDQGRFHVCVSRDPRGRPATLDAARAPRGMLMFRVVLPAAPVEAPTVRVDAPT